jgi:protein dithiol oxidoreductase (disulfide-forming)
MRNSLTSFRTSFTLMLALVCGLCPLWSHAKPVLDTEYKLLNPAQSTTGKGVEVLEFFNYACSHCYEFEPLLKSWLKNKPKEAEFRYVPAVFNEKMLPLAKLHYALDEMGLLDKLHEKIYFAIHQHGQNLMERAVMVKWLAEQAVDVKKFESVFDSFGVDSKAKRAAQMTRNYRIPGTPYLIVGGRYLTGPSMTLKGGEGVDAARFVQVLNELIDMSRPGAK